MKRLFILLVIFLGLLNACNDSNGSQGKLPKLDTGTNLRGKEVDGIREDVLKEIEKKFKEKYKDKPGIYRALVLSAWNTQRVFDIDPSNKEQAKHKGILTEVSATCVIEAYKEYMIPYLEKKYGVKFPDVLDIKEAKEEYYEGLDEIYDNAMYIIAITYNTYERVKFYDRYNQTLSGTVSSDIVDRLNRAGIGACEFMERIKKEWEKTGNITKIDFYQLLEQMKKERERQK